MKNIYLLFQFLTYAILGVGLSNCQRAAYSFQAPSSTVTTVNLTLATAPDVASTPANYSAGSTLHKKRPIRTQPRAVRRAPRATTAKLHSFPRVKKSTVRVERRKAEEHSRVVQEPAPQRQRSKGIALVLAFLLGSFGAHRFYLAYYGQGAAYVGLTALAVLFFTVGFLAFVFASSAYSGFLVAALVLSILLQGWLVADIVRIITGNLKPKNGEYYPRFFQTRPDANTPPGPTK